MDGRLEKIDGRWQLQLTRRLPHPPEKVWRALTEPQHLAAWFPFDIEGERAPDAALRFVSRNGEAPPFDGEMTGYDPPSVLEIRWGSDETLRFEVCPEGDGSVLTLLNRFDERGKAARDAAGWHTCLDAPGYRLDGEATPWTTNDRWQQVHLLYVERFGPEASTIGPPVSRSKPG